MGLHLSCIQYSWALESACLSSKPKETCKVPIRKLISSFQAVGMFFVCVGLLLLGSVRLIYSPKLAMTFRFN